VSTTVSSVYHWRIFTFFVATAGPLLTEYVPQGGTKFYNYSFTDSDVPGTVEPPPDVKDVDQLGKEMDDFKMEVDPDVPCTTYKLSSRSGLTLFFRLQVENPQN
jgi:hypothetical protein